MLTTISGVFVKIAFADQVDILLSKGEETRPAARYNRRGEDALYLSANETSARVAMQKYANSPGPSRVLIRYEVESCQLLDLRHSDANEIRILASGDWQQSLANGAAPSSWQVSDNLRKSGQVGLIDQSRKNPGLWHVTLLRWNEPGAPGVTFQGQPESFTL